MVDIMVIGARGIPDVEGGAEKHAEALFPLLVEKGYSVELVAMRRFARAQSYRGVRLKLLPTLSVGNTDKLIYHFLAFAYAVVRRPKLVHLQGLNSALLLALYKLCGLKVVVRYGSADHEYAKWGLVGRIGFRLCELQIRFADYLIAVSQKYKSVLERRYGLERIQVVPNGIDPANVSEEANAYWSTLGLRKGRYVLAVGRLTVDKDYETLIEAFGQLQDPDLRLVIAGGASENGYADRLAAMQSDRVRLLGRVDRRLLASLYANCGVYVNCSLHEGLSNAVLEAISHACPIVVSDIPANVEMALSPASYFPAGDAGALAGRLEAALAEPAEFVSPAGQFLDWASVAIRTEAVYQRVLPGLGKQFGLGDETLSSGGQGAMRQGVAMPRAEAGPGSRRLERTNATV
jgi:glycosyltransferase involved in cell wall biosynthesis